MTAQTLNERGSNRLPTLAAEVRRAHSGVIDAAKTAAERAIEAGKALLEAKELVKHGEWGTWLKENCQLPERTAQLYMAIAKSGLNSATVADIGLKAAAKVEWTFYSPDYEPFAQCDDEGKRGWHLFVLFLAQTKNARVENVARHVEWILQRQFKSPDDWLGEEGVRFRRPYGMHEPSEQFKKSWTSFREQHNALTADDAELAVCRHAATEPPSPKRKRRLRCGHE